MEEREPSCTVGSHVNGLQPLLGSPVQNSRLEEVLGKWRRARNTPAWCARAEKHLLPLDMPGAKI